MQHLIWQIAQSARQSTIKCKNKQSNIVDDKTLNDNWFC